MRTAAKRGISLIIAVVMLLSATAVMTIRVGATSRTASDALSWCQSQVGKALDYDGSYGAQCVDFIYYYYQYLGVGHVGGNAIDFTWNSLPSGWQRIAGAQPQPGDILVYNNSPYGHVGVYASESLMYHQAPSLGGRVLRDAHNYKYYQGYWGVIRPNFSSGGSSGTTNPASSSWRWPVSGQIFGRGFGAHKAIDIVAPAGTPVFAAKEGTVVCASTASASASYQCPTCTYSGAGYHVVLRHPDGFYSFYDHLSSVSVSAGTNVSGGQRVGAVGSTGNSTGAHLHFAISSSGLYALVDPLIYLTPFSSVTANVTSNDVTLTGTFGAYGPTMQTAGFYIGTSKSNMTKITETLNTNGYTNGVAIVNIFYSMSKWYPHLVKGNTYYYKMYITRDGKEYCSNIQSFTYGTHTHKWNSGSITTSPTCTAQGTRTYTCTECGNTKTESVAALGHSTEYVAAKAATPNINGWIAHYKCTRCGKLFADSGATKELSAAQVTVKYTAPSNPVTIAAPTVSVKEGTSYAEVTISAENIPASGLCSTTVYIECNGLDIVGYRAAGGIKGINDFKFEEATPGNLTWVWCAIGNERITHGPAELIKLTVRLPETAKAGDRFDISIRVPDDPDDFVDGNDNGVGAVVRKGSITVAGSPHFTPGDVNNDNSINAKDIILIMKYIINKNKPVANFNERAADFDGDGDINAKDIIKIMKWIIENRSV